MKILSSPVLEKLQNLLHVDKQDSKPIYLQLALQMASAIQNAILQPGIQLPGTRQLSETLKLHRKTIVAAYEELTSQGLITMIPNKGSYVNRDIVRSFSQSEFTDEKNILPLQTQNKILQNRILELEKNITKGNWILDDGKMDRRILQSEKWNVGLASILNKPSISASFLKHQLVQYLLENQHISVLPEQILTFQNATMATSLLMQALLQKDDIVLVGAPGNYRVNMAIQQSGARLHSIAVEPDGLDIAAIEDICKKQTIKMVYVDAQNHYPTTSILSYAKRLILLQLAQQYHFWLVEDESQSVCDFQKKKLPSLLSLDKLGVVIQVNSFEQVVKLEWNMAFILAPSSVLGEIEKYKTYLGIAHYGIAESIMANILQSGTLQRMTKKVSKIYWQRRNVFCQLINTSWKNHVQYEVPKNGLALWVNFEWDFNLAAFAKRCASNGLVIPNHLLYQSRNWNGMRLGYGSWTETEMENIVSSAKKSF